MMLLITVIMLSAWAIQADDLFSPNINIIEELGKIKIMGKKMEFMEKEIERLKTKIADTQVNGHDITTLQQRVGALEDKVEEQRSKNEERVKVAFSASLSSLRGLKYIGPYEEDTALVYENVFTNTGNAYDSDTGIFTAPVKGVYFFSLVLFTNDALSTGVKLLKNGDLVVAVTDNPPSHTQDTEDTATNSVSLLLEKGDQISLKLLKKRRIYTDGFRRNTFSGHLLFTI